MSVLVFSPVLIIFCQKISLIVLASLQSIGHTSPRKIAGVVDLT